MNTPQDIHFYFFSDIPDEGVFAAEGQEVVHMTKVMRLAEGASVHLCNGQGRFFEARIVKAKKDKAVLEILGANDGAIPKSELTIAIAPTKNIDRFEWFLEKATEIGVGHIVALECERSERRRIKQERCERILISAMKQSGRSWLPRFSGLIPFDVFAQDAGEHAFIAHCGGGEKTLFTKGLEDSPTALTICIGPEGDFTEKEIQVALANGMKAVTLGISRLRTETAGLVACSMYQSSLE